MGIIVQPHTDKAFQNGREGRSLDVSIGNRNSYLDQPGGWYDFGKPEVVRSLALTRVHISVEGRVTAELGTAYTFEAPNVRANLDIALNGLSYSVLRGHNKSDSQNCLGGRGNIVIQFTNKADAAVFLDRLEQRGLADGTVVHKIKFNLEVAASSARNELPAYSTPNNQRTDYVNSNAPQQGLRVTASAGNHEIKLKVFHGERFSKECLSVADLVAEAAKLGVDTNFVQQVATEKLNLRQ